MKIRGIDHVQLAMPRGEEDKAREFYGRVLGLPEVAKPPALRVDDLDAFEGVCRAAGLHPQHDSDLPGYRRFYVHHPFANRLELLQPLDPSAD
jgi:catechol 2,3-dioxygenase-like lactoylglutathione lyase family enzyme